jgi:hypothetical protein
LTESEEWRETKHKCNEDIREEPETGVSKITETKLSNEMAAPVWQIA